MWFFVFLVFIVISYAYANDVESQKSCALENLKQNAQTYYNAVNLEDKKTMYSFEAEEYKKRYPLANYEPQLLEMKHAGKFEKLSIKSVELRNTDIATVVVDFLIFNKEQDVWFTDGSFLQSWVCRGDTWFVNTLPAVILLK